jgi:hypothetical protein
VPKVYNPDTQETRDVSGREVQQAKADGFVVVGNRPEAEYLGKTREELLADDEDDADAGDGTEASSEEE